MMGKMDCCGATDQGLVRDQNEDQFIIAELHRSMLVRQSSIGLDAQTRLFGRNEGHLLLVADGMGGHAAGERASTLAVDGVIESVLNSTHWLINLDRDRDDQFLADLKSMLGFCQERLRSEIEVAPRRQGMGTTLSMAYLVWPRLYVVHVGDSRCYLFRNAKLQQITHDHTVAQQLMEKGVLDRSEVESSRWNNVLWNVIGGNTDELRPEIHTAELAIGDTLLLCTDGLSGQVPDERIGEVLSQNLSAAEMCRRLIDAANEAGGDDNVTVVIARFLSAEESHAAHHAAAEAKAEEVESPVASKKHAPAAEAKKAAVLSEPEEGPRAS